MRNLMRSNSWGRAFSVPLLWLLLLSACWLAFSSCAMAGRAVTKEESVASEVYDPRIPTLAYRLKRIVIAESHYWWGLDHKPTTFFAQIHQESAWDPEAKSPYASGLAQFTPDTAEWISNLYPADLGENNPLDSRWAIRACIRYDRWLYEKASFAFDDDHRWRFLLSGYNGGWGNVLKDREFARMNGKYRDRWTCNVEHFSKRASSAFRENRNYVRRILDVFVPIYKKACF